ERQAIDHCVVITLWEAQNIQKMKQKERMVSRDEILLRVAVGFALGAIAGLLLAPQSGEATLAQLSEQGAMLRTRSGSLGEELKTRAAEAVTAGRQLYDRTRDE